MQTNRVILLALALGNMPLVAGPVLTAPGSGAFDYIFRGNTVAAFGATGLLVPGQEYNYPAGAIFPLPPALIELVWVSDTGVWSFYSRFTLCCWTIRTLTPATPQVPGPGTTIYGSVVDSFYDVMLENTQTIPGTASLTIVPAPEPATAATTAFAICIISILVVCANRAARGRIQV
ncbi:MAG: hypothetical protein JO270_26505 [Acidobacteriaceae bacterium]|nr:hypothetical protein [Acidobacteriaceae bacterium]